MRFRAAAFLLLAGWAGPSARCEMRDVLKSAEIDAIFARTSREMAVHERPNYAILFQVHDGKSGPYEMRPGADDVLFARRGRATVLLGGDLTAPQETPAGNLAGTGLKAARRYEVGAGDVVNIPRRTPHQIDPGRGRFECVVVRVFPAGENLPARGPLAPRRMGDVVRKSEIDAVFAGSDRNQPLHSAPNFTINYVIYSGHPGPWEAHRGCVDVYFLHTGTARAQLGGEILNPKEESPGEIRGTGVSGARAYTIGPGDMVLIPRSTAHYMDPGSGKLGYLLLKVWAE